jgi:hypothetical protein
VKLWFLQLSGWPIFLAVIGVTAAFMVIASVLLTKLGNRSLMEALVLASSALVVLTFVILAVFMLASR